MTKFQRCAAFIGLTGIMLSVLLAGHGTARADEGPTQLGARIRNAREVYRELITSPDRDIPQALLEDCKCVAIFPRVLKGAIGFGARYGKGVVTCRDSAGQWSSPAFFKLTGGSWGLQIGAEATDLVLFFMTERGTRSLLESKFTLGAKAGVAAGPAGRSAEASTDLKLDSEIYSYGRSKGLFAGLSLEGARVAASNEDNYRYYGAPLKANQILFEHQAPPRRPAEVDSLLNALP